VTDDGDVEQQAEDLAQDLLENCQGELAVAQDQVDHLKTALVTARRIGAAVGILMVQNKITDDAAFELLRSESQQRNCKLRDIAEGVVLTGTLDAPAGT
jgi:AmiR/NasT family two-component response regulator